MKKQTENARNSVIGGLALMALGTLILANNFGHFTLSENVGLLLLPGLGVLFTIAGVTSRSAGYFIPGGILMGVGAGIVLEANSFGLQLLTDFPEGGAFMLAFAAGWLSIVVFTLVFSDDWQWWAIIPTLIFGLIGGTVLFGGVMETMLSVLGQSWPVILIAVGIKTLLDSNASKA